MLDASAIIPGSTAAAGAASKAHTASAGGAGFSIYSPCSAGASPISVQCGVVPRAARLNRFRDGAAIWCGLDAGQGHADAGGWDTMSELASKQCVPCRGGVPPLQGDELATYQQQLGGGWQVVNEHHLEKEYTFDDFRQALDFTVQVGEMAEEQDHHPDILLTWGLVKVTIWTHKIDGLTESDFVFAAKADRLSA